MGCDYICITLCKVLSYRDVNFRKCFTCIDSGWNFFIYSWWLSSRGELVATDILKNTLVKSKTDYYHKICKYLTQLIERMYMFKTNAEKNRVINKKK